MESSDRMVPVLRVAASQVVAAARATPVVVLMGARQTGKSTLVQTLPGLAGHRYLTLDDFDLRSQAEVDPEAVVARAPKLIIDEVQRARDVLIAVKRAVDSDHRRTKGRFVLTGSANLLAMERLAETLAGRASYVTLWPMGRRERLGLGQTGIWDRFFDQPPARWPSLVADRSEPADWRAEVRRGGFPEPALTLDEEQRRHWFTGYVRTFLERDLPAFRAVERPIEFRRLMEALALRTGALVNQAEVGRDLGMSQPQVHRYLSILETGYQIVRVPAFSVNRTKRLIKTPKLYWADTGLGFHLSGVREPRGADLENLILSDLLVWREAQARRAEVCYWRTAAGAEVDFVVERGRQVLPIEVKAAARVGHQDAAALEVFLDEYPDLARGGLVLHGGSEVGWLTRRVLAMPWWLAC